MAKETQEFGQNFANKLKGGETLALIGDLGGGKTTFVKGLAQGLGIKENITSPTFILMKEYDIKIKDQKSKIKNLYHLDLYRLEGDIEKEVKNLGIEDIWGKEENIVVIEWADKIEDMLPPHTIRIYFEEIGDERKIMVK